MTNRITFKLNNVEVTADISNPTQLLIDYLHNVKGLFGTKYGCGEGGCGACTVVLKRNGERKFDNCLLMSFLRLFLYIIIFLGKHEVINSCLRPLIACEGLEILTVEGLERDIYAPMPTSCDSVANLQQPDGFGHSNRVAYAIAKEGGSQCGYCTPGFTMTLNAAKHNQEVKDHSHCCEEDIEELYAGHLCRCTGYRALRLAAKKILLPTNSRKLEYEASESPEMVVDVMKQSYI